MIERRVFPLIPVLLLLVVFGYAFSRLYHVLIPFILSLAIAYVANPLVDAFEVRGLRRPITVAALYLVISSLIGLAANSLTHAAASELSFLQAQAPTYMERFRYYVALAQNWAAHKLPYGGFVVKHWDIKLYSPLIEQLQNVPGYVLGLFPLLSFLFLIPFITFFLLMDGPRGIHFLIQTCPSRYVEQALHLLSEIDASLGNYLRGIIIVAAAIAAASFAGLEILGVNQSLAIAVLAGVSSFIPYLGAVIGAVVGGLAASFQFGTAVSGLKVVVLFMGIRLADEAFLQPFIAKYSVRLHPLVFLGSLLVGGELFGFLGLVFAVPAACVVKSLIKVAWAWYATETHLTLPQSLDASALPYT